MATERRSAVIEKADEMMLAAEAVLASPPARLGPDAITRRAARRFTAAADIYRRGGLGLMVKRCHERAAELWDSIGERALTRASLGLAKATPVYWDGDV
jgi:hypothetical protein